GASFAIFSVKDPELLRSVFQPQIPARQPQFMAFLPVGLCSRDVCRQPFRITPSLPYFLPLRLRLWETIRLDDLRIPLLYMLIVLPAHSRKLLSSKLSLHDTTAHVDRRRQGFLLIRYLLRFGTRHPLQPQ